MSLFLPRSVSPQGRRWRRVIDTSPASPDDIAADEANGKPVAKRSRYAVGASSVVVIVTKG